MVILLPSVNVSYSLMVTGVVGGFSLSIITGTE